MVERLCFYHRQRRHCVLGCREAGRYLALVDDCAGCRGCCLRHHPHVGEVGLVLVPPPPAGLGGGTSWRCRAKRATSKIKRGQRGRKGASTRLPKRTYCEQRTNSVRCL